MRARPGYDAAPVPAPAVAGGGGEGGGGDNHMALHSPVPYLFGGLAAMVGLIALALFILACSYWKASGFHEGGGRGEESGGGEEELYTIIAGARRAAAEYEERVVVIMAGDEKPTYLATRMMSRPVRVSGNRRRCNDGGVDGDADGEEESKVNGTETQRKEQDQNNRDDQNLED